MKKEFKREKRKNNKYFKYIVILAVLIIPFMYSFFYLKAYWDPYGKGNIDNLPVAVVNNDVGEKGDELVDSIIDSGKLKISVISNSEAEKGLNTGDYYAVINIPKNFTSSLESASQIDKKHATITYSPNQKSSYLASQIINSVVNAVEKKLDNQVNSTIIENLSSVVKEVPTSLEKISAGFEKLEDGTSTLNQGAIKLKEGTITLKNGTSNLKNGTDELTTGAIDLKRGTETLSLGAKNLASGTINLKNGTSKLTIGTNELVIGSNSLKEGTEQLAMGTNTLNKNYATFNAGLYDLKNGLKSLDKSTDNLSYLGFKLDGASNSLVSLNNISSLNNEVVDNYVNASTEITTDINDIKAICNNSTSNDPDLINICSVLSSDTMNDNLLTINDNSTKVITYSENINTGISKLSSQLNDNTVSQISTQLKDLKTGIVNLNKGAETLYENSKLIEQGINGIDSGASNIYNGTSKLHTGLLEVNTGMVNLDNGATELNTGATTLAKGATELNSGALKLSNGAKELSRGASTLNNGVINIAKGTNNLSNGINTLNSSVIIAKQELDENIISTKKDITKVDGLAEYSVEPVIIKTEPVNEISSYGTAFSPLFISIALWVGCLMMFVVLYYDKEQRFGILSKDDARVLKRTLFYHGLATLSAIILGLLLQFLLNFSITNILLYYLAIILTANAFMGIMEFLITNFNDVGKFLALIVLVLQLAAAGGTFPIETVSSCFRWLNNLLPMTYTIKLLKEPLMSIESGLLLKNILVVISIFVIFFIVNIINDIRIEKKQTNVQNI